MNEQILGKIDRHGRDLGRWRFPLKDGKLSDVKFQGPDARKVIKGLPLLIDVCMYDMLDEVRQKWKEAAALFAQTMNTVISHKLFKYEDVCAFQDVTDRFCDLYLSLTTGRDGMTNYFHNICAGHFSYFLLKRGNLY